MDTMDTVSLQYSNFSNNSKNVCMCTTISIFLIILFIISPLNKYFITSLFGKIIALLILAYALYQNFTNTIFFYKSTNTSLMKGSWSPIKTNILCSYIFSFFILLLIFSLIKHMIY